MTALSSDEDSGTESDLHDVQTDLNDSLKMAIKTAKQLHNMSRVMKKNLKDELVHNFND